MTTTPIAFVDSASNTQGLAASSSSTMYSILGGWCFVIDNKQQIHRCTRQGDTREFFDPAVIDSAVLTLATASILFMAAYIPKHGKLRRCCDRAWIISIRLLQQAQHTTPSSSRLSLLAQAVATIIDSDPAAANFDFINQHGGNSTQSLTGTRHQR